MRFGSKLGEVRQEIPLAPLIDVIFLLLIFFVSASVYQQIEAELSVTLPTASEARQNPRQAGEIIVNIREDGALVMNGREMSLETLTKILIQVADGYPGQAVKIRGDESARLGRAMDVLNACAKADIWNVYFAALQEERTESS